MKKLIRATRLLMLIAVTAVALVVMWYMSSKQIKQLEPSVAPPEAARTRVEVQLVRPEQRIALYDTYTGMIRPFERVVMEFEVAGRVTSLGKSNALDRDDDRMLDVGDTVTEGQLLAQLDRRALAARLAEAKSRLTPAQSDYERAVELRKINPEAISERDFQRRSGELEAATAAVALAEKQLADATLTAPFDGVISKRHVYPGELVNAHEAAFEVVQVDRVLLMLGVPESDIPEIEARFQEAISKTYDQYGVDVEIVGRDRFGRRWPSREGTVYRVAETADQTTGLFDVEVLIENEDGLLKPGVVAVGHLQTTHVAGLRVPADSVIFRKGDAYMYVVNEEPIPVRALCFEVGQRQSTVARRLDLSRWVLQGPEVVVPGAEADFDAVVVRGHRRLVDNQPIEIVGRKQPDAGTPGEPPFQTAKAPAAGK